MHWNIWITWNQIIQRTILCSHTLEVYFFTTKLFQGTVSSMGRLSLEKWNKLPFITSLTIGWPTIQYTRFLFTVFVQYLVLIILIHYTRSGFPAWLQIVPTFTCSNNARLHDWYSLPWLNAIADHNNCPQDLYWNQCQMHSYRQF